MCGIQVYIDSVVDSDSSWHRRNFIACFYCPTCYAYPILVL